MSSDEEIRKRTWFLDAIVDNIPTMVFVKDAKDLRFELFNRAGQELIGVGIDALRGKSDHDFFPKEQADFFTARDREVLATGAEVTVEEPIQARGGERWLYTKKIPLRDEQGEVKYLLGVSLDITDRKAAEAEQGRLNEQLRQAVAQLMAMEEMVIAGQVAAEHAGELLECLERGDAASLGRARQIAERLRQVTR